MGVLDLIGFSREIGSRFTLVTVFPLFVFALFVLALLWSGAPGQAPDLDQILDQARDLDLLDAGALILSLILLGLLTEPLQVSLVRAFEGYWGNFWLFRPLTQLAGGRQRTAFKKLNQARRAPDESRESRAAIIGPDQEFKSRFPEDQNELLPTRLGNVLRATETRAGAAYGLQMVIIWPRLYPLLSEPVRALVQDRVNQLDLSVRLSATFVLSAVVALGLLINHGWWLAVPLVCLLLAFFSYRAAIAAAIAYGEAVRVAIDLHRFDLIEALHLPLPSNLSAERMLNEQVNSLLLQDFAEELIFAHVDTAPGPPASTPAAGPAAKAETKPG